MNKSQASFMEQLKPLVIEDAVRSGILASLTAAQAILESGWGMSAIAKKCNNLFGMKGDFQGAFENMPTKEWNGTKYVTVKAKFRKYPSWDFSIADHSLKFLTMQRYANLRGVTDYKVACQNVQNDGYATAPNYASKLIQMIEQYNLQEWDAEALQKRAEVSEVTKNNGITTLQHTTVDFGSAKSNKRTEKITKITPHHMAVVTDNPDKVALVHRDGTREASANYYIAGGRICAGVSEDRRAWTSSSEWNDQRAITIEVANCTREPHWEIAYDDYMALVRLCADVCNRYDIEPHWTGTKDGSITIHSQFSGTTCPGPWLKYKITSGQFEYDVKSAMGTIAKRLYRVQVGAFKSRENAEAYKQQIIDSGEKAFVVEAGGFYKVQVGAYSERENAERHALLIKEKGYSAFIA